MKLVTVLGAALSIGVATWLASGSAFADTMDCSGTKIAKERRNFEVIKPGDRPDRQLRQYVRLDVLSSDNPALDGTEQTVFVHEELIGPVGRHSGVGEFALRNGERLWYRFQGTSFRTDASGTWTARYHGVYEFLSGSGRYSAIQGAAHYEGEVTPSAQTERFTCSATY